MKLVLDDFNVYIDMNTHLAKLRLCFNKCQTFGINLNPKNACLWYFGVIFGYIVFKECNYRIPKDIGHNQHAGTQNPQGCQSVQWCGLILSMFHTRRYLYYGPHRQIPLEN
jgi:hypothetical protein